MKFSRMRFGAALMALVVSVSALMPEPLRAAATYTVKNYMTPCTGFNCDNVAVFGGTVKIGTTTLTATAAELNKNAGVTAGTISASKVVVVDANGAVLTWKTASLRLGTSGAETTVTATGTEINALAGVTLGTPAASKVVSTDANTAVLSSLGIQFGGATTTTAGKPAAGLVDSTSTASGTTQNTEYTLNFVTVKGSAFNAATRGIECDTWGTSAANANAKDYKFYFGATALATLTGTTDSAKDYKAHLSVVRVGSNTQSGFAEITSDVGAPDAFAASAALAITEASDIVIAFKTTNTAAAAASATGKGMRCTFLN